MKNKMTAVLLLLLLVLGTSGCKTQNEQSAYSIPTDSNDQSDVSAEESVEESPASDFSFHEIDGEGIVYYHGKDEHVVIPSQIDGKAVTAIGSQGFYRNENLISVTVPASVTVIKDEAFNYCSNLKEVRLTAGLQKIERDAFKNCISLTDITFPDTLTTFGESAFMNCASLKYVRIPASVTQWYGGAFYYSGVERVELEEGLTQIGYGAFAVTKLKEIVLSDSIQIIEQNAFNGCDQLEKVVLNEGLKTISAGAFGHCSALKEIVIPETVTEVTDRAFGNSENLEYVIFDGDAPETFLDPNFLAIGSYYVCYKEGARGFTAPYWNHYKTAVVSDDYQTFQKSGITSDQNYEYFETDGNIEIVRYLGSSKKVTIPSKIDGKPVTSIGYAAFASNAELEKLYIPSSVLTVGDYAFAYCEKLAEITFAEGLQAIGSNAFCLCTEVTLIDLPSTLTSLGDEAFSNCRGLTEVTVPASVTEWGDGTFAFTSIASVTLEEGLTYIGQSAFHGAKVTEIVLPDSIREIKDSAFYDCDLSSVTLNEGLETVGTHAFGWNYSLTEVIVPASVTQITEYAFEGCRGLESVKFEGDAPSNYMGDDEEMINRVMYTVYYHEDAEGFTSPLWNGFATEIW